MKEKIEYLIAEYRENRQEIWSLLEELNKIDSTKFSKQEKEDIKKEHIKLEESYHHYGNVITDLENL